MWYVPRSDHRIVSAKLRYPRPFQMVANAGFVHKDSKLVIESKPAGPILSSDF